MSEGLANLAVSEAAVVLAVGVDGYAIAGTVVAAGASYLHNLDPGLGKGLESADVECSW